MATKVTRPGHLNQCLIYPQLTIALTMTLNIQGCFFFFYIISQLLDTGKTLKKCFDLFWVSFFFLFVFCFF